MIAKLDDGTELYFDDDLPDEEVDRRVAQHVERAAIVAAIRVMEGSMVEEIRRGFAAMIEAELRPRILERDMMGRPQKAKPEPKK